MRSCGLSSGVLPFLFLSGLAVVGCGPSVPTFPHYGLDAGIECDDENECGSGEVCLQGRCYDECTATSCGPGETCMGGVCRGLMGDAGRDGGSDAPAPDVPPDPCSGLGCVAPTPFCIAGTCVACLTRDDCPPGAPICDESVGRCVAFDAGIPVCAPCNRDLDCPAGTCQMLGSEHVCLVAPSGTTCPAGFEASGAVCVPSIGQTCRSYRLAVGGVACTAAAECVPLGVTPNPGLCTGGGTCGYLCGTPTDCPAALPTCPDGFCAP